jgi:hypothetical protein
VIEAYAPRRCRCRVRNRAESDDDNDYDNDNEEPFDRLFKTFDVRDLQSLSRAITARMRQAPAAQRDQSRYPIEIEIGIEIGIENSIAIQAGADCADTDSDSDSDDHGSSV